MDPLDDLDPCLPDNTGGYQLVSYDGSTGLFQSHLLQNIYPSILNCMNVVSIVLLSIIGIAFLISVTLYLIYQSEMNPQTIWVTRQLSLCDASKPQYGYWVQISQKKNITEIIMEPDPMIEHLQNKGVVVYNSKIEFKKDLLEDFCEGLGCGCRSGIVASFLISKKDLDKFNELIYG